VKKSISYRARSGSSADPDAGLESYFWPADTYPNLHIAARALAYA